MSFRRTLLLPALAALPLGAPAGAQTFPHQPLEQRLAAAELVVRARVLAERETVVPSGEMAFTWVTFAADDVLIDRTGFVAGPTFELPFAGGEVDGRHLRVRGVPRFEVGEEVLFLAQVTGPRLASPLIGGAQSLWRLERDRDGERRYPLTVGGRALYLTAAGELAPTAPLVSVDGGRPTYRAPAVSIGAIAPPTPVAGSGARAAVVRPTGAPRPAAIVDSGVLRDVLLGLEAERLAALEADRSKGGAK